MEEKKSVNLLTEHKIENVVQIMIDIKISISTKKENFTLFI